MFELILDADMALPLPTGNQKDQKKLFIFATSRFLLYGIIGKFLY